MNFDKVPYNNLKHSIGKLEFNFKSPTLLINIVNAFDYFMTYRSENIKDNKFILLEMYFH